MQFYQVGAFEGQKKWDIDRNSGSTEVTDYGIWAR